MKWAGEYSDRLVINFDWLSWKIIINNIQDVTLTILKVEQCCFYHFIQHT